METKQNKTQHNKIVCTFYGHTVYEFLMAELVVNIILHDWCPLVARFMGPTWGPHGADRTQVGPMLAP